jgi:hypothetical protein
MVNNSINTNKTKERLNSDAFFYFVDIGGIVDQHCLNFFCFVDIDAIIDHHCLNFLLFC